MGLGAERIQQVLHPDPCTLSLMLHAHLYPPMHFASTGPHGDSLHTMERVCMFVQLGQWVHSALLHAPIYREWELLESVYALWALANQCR